jgi:hypothetical protein
MIFFILIKTVDLILQKVKISLEKAIFSFDNDSAK